MLRIMLIEDNKADAMLTKEILKETKLEHELVWINEGKKALDHIVSDRAFDMFILDLNLPKASGREVLSRLRKMDWFGKTPVIVMTGSISPVDKTITEGDDNLFYLVKPMTMGEIDRTVSVIKEIVSHRLK
jgi:two-component system, chemotaxis family, response regulator Rcp1